MSSLIVPFRRILAIAIASSSVLLVAPAAPAAEEVVFRYGIFRQRLAVSELTDFAETGEISPVLQRYLKRANSDPESVRETLTRPIEINHNVLDNALNNPGGDRMLDELGKMIQTPNDENNREALRTALIKATENDNRLTLLEVIQNYPTDEIHLDVKRAIKTYNRLAEYQGPIQQALDGAESLRRILKNQGVNLPNILK
ncbi:alpha/beta hydrolase [Kovacikia minuta CCNUW1]|uniref:alpha/beta hydrolase n=1 Tax=Kovacikia minuta TaxID=2931930 RepID=UPI001CCB449C|nr:alpha/beta hydrolase [Kovacikia minuta]UBF24086.1 alpha/beta hydrolase [Kovacikia minuta CCNUW1]